MKRVSREVLSPLGVSAISCRAGVRERSREEEPRRPWLSSTLLSALAEAAPPLGLGWAPSSFLCLQHMGPTVPLHAQGPVH